MISGTQILAKDQPELKLKAGTYYIVETKYKNTKLPVMAQADMAAGSRTITVDFGDG